MKVAYDFNGKVMKVQEVNPDRLVPNQNKPMNIIHSHVNKDF